MFRSRRAKLNIKKFISCIFVGLIFYFSLTPPVYAAGEPKLQRFELTHTIRVPVNSASGIAYELVISLPTSYQSSPDKKYPVLYYTDAYWDAPLLSSIYLDLAFDRAVPEMIMVGLSYAGDGINHSALRTRDLTPSKDSGVERESGGGAAFLKFIKETVVPKIEKEYRVNKGERAIAGWSFGGIFALYAMYQEPSFFNRCIAISPSVRWHNGFLNSVDEEFAKLHKPLNARVFISYAANEDVNFIATIADFQRQLVDRSYAQLTLKNYVVENMGHAGAKSIGYAQGMAWVWSDQRGSP